MPPCYSPHQAWHAKNHTHHAGHFRAFRNAVGDAVPAAGVRPVAWGRTSSGVRADGYSNVSNRVVVAGAPVLARRGPAGGAGGRARLVPGRRTLRSRAAA